MRVVSEKAQFAKEFVNLKEASGIDDAIWEKFQLEYLNNTSRLSIDVKARQIAWSFTAALDAVVDGILTDNTPHMFVSINLDEAKEKIRYAKSIYESIHRIDKPRIVRDSQTTLEFSNGSRLISHPCKPIRGKAKARVYLDEMAHYGAPLDRQIYLSALPSTTRGGGYMRVGSSPFGAQGLFWEIATESMKGWPGFSRGLIYWWEITALCTDVDDANEHALDMLTEQRVYKYGTPPLIEIFENMFLEDFRQEYECEWTDETTAWISWEDIIKNQSADHIWWHAKSVSEALVMLDAVDKASGERRIEFAFVGGIDVGRKRDLTEMVVLGRTTTGELPVRFSVSLDKVQYDDQERCFLEIINRLPFTKVLVDNNGIGAQLAENLWRKTKVAEEFPFTNPSKELLAVESRIQTERGQTPLPIDRDIAYQIHSIKKTVTASKHSVYDAEKNALHHADKYWAWALGVYAAKQPDGATWEQLEEAGVGHVDDYNEQKPWRA